MDFDAFSSIKIDLASPDQIRKWSCGEVKKPETINYRTLKPEKEGLFCERIFGPIKDWECNCGKYKRLRYKGKICERCGVEVTNSNVRRERMGHIELAAPVSHIWYFKGIPSRIGLLLDISPKRLEEVLYFVKYIVVEPGDTELEKGQILTEQEYKDMYEKYEDDFVAKMGAEAVKELLQKIDLKELYNELKKNIEKFTGQKKVKAIRRFDIVKAFLNSKNKMEWMILDVIPVIPPDLRPMVQLEAGRFATSDLNDLYRRVINRNNRLKRLLELKAPDIIVKNEKRMLQEAVDALIDNGRRGRAVTGPNNRPLKSLSDMLKGKQGRFRQNLLGKRVDYSGRSVIVVGPELKMYQCGLPKEMALELFKPFVMKKLVEKGIASNIKSARKMIERGNIKVWDCLETVIKGRPVLLNRAPTLHRLGIQAFEPVLVEGKALKLHPLVCTAYNADFDGDQMAVHVPLSIEAQTEARFLMLAANNLLKPSDGKPITVPTNDMVLGAYYLTIEKESEKGEKKAFKDFDEAIMAYENGCISLHAKIKVRVTKTINEEQRSCLIETTAGKIIFNRVIPQDLGFVDRSGADTYSLFQLEINFKVGKKQLEEIVSRSIEQHGVEKTSKVLDKIKELGFKYSTKGAVTVGIGDAVIPSEKKALLEEADEKISKVVSHFKKGLISDEERYEKVISIWNKTTDLVSDALTKTLDEDNPISMMANSGARGSINQIRQLAGMRGLIANTSGATIEIPIKSSYREGLNILEYFISSRGTRKGFTDTALRTADSGYLTRRLVDVAQEVIVLEHDCKTEKGIEVCEIKEGNEIFETLKERLTGRFSCEDVLDPKTGEVLISNEKMITSADAQKIVDSGIKSLKIRSILTCEAELGVCSKCYGVNLARNDVASIGEAVGTIAAQSIGEPGTQLTMKNFHTGGIASSEDITQGLPRVEELFECRRPKYSSIISEIEGKVKVEEIKLIRHVLVESKDGEKRDYSIPFGFRLKVKDGQTIKAGDPLTEGPINPYDVLAIKGEQAVQNYLIFEVQKTYRLQGVDINDKHIEVIIRQMMRKVRILNPGESEFVGGSCVEKEQLLKEIRKLKEKGIKKEQLPTWEPVLLGITKASLATDSFLSAASFQETTRVLADAAVNGKVDPLIGLKENVIIGKLIPAGTGLSCYQKAEIKEI